MAVADGQSLTFGQKLGQGLLNILTIPVTLASSIAAGWTSGGFKFGTGTTGDSGSWFQRNQTIIIIIIAAIAIMFMFSRAGVANFFSKKKVSKRKRSKSVYEVRLDNLKKANATRKKNAAAKKKSGK